MRFIMKPYTYYLYHRPTGKKYYGVRTAQGCSPNDLWKIYFSSSTAVKQLINEYGIDSFDYEVRRIFTDKKEALKWERNVLTRLKASQNSDWLNRNNGGGAGSHTKETREKIKKNNAKYWKGTSRPDISEKFKGHKVTEETKKKISEKLKGKPLSEETRKKMKGRTPWNKGKKAVQVAWNKGLTSATDERVKSYGKKLKQTKNTKEYKEKISNILKESFKSTELRTLLSDKNSKYFGNVLSPEGITYEVIGLNRFCKKHGLSPSSLRNLKINPNKTYKGWKYLHENNH